MCSRQVSSGFQPGELGVEGYGPENAVKGELVLSEEIDPVGGKRRDAALAGEGIARGHVVARATSPQRGLPCLSLLRALRSVKVVGDDDEPLTPFLQGWDQVEILVAVAIGDDPAEVGIAVGVPDQEHGPVPLS